MLLSKTDDPPTPFSSRNFRFMLSLGRCPVCLFCDDELNILPLSSTAKEIKALPPIDPLDTAEQQELRDLQVRRDIMILDFLTTTHHPFKAMS